MMADYVKEMTVKKSCRYAQYGSFEHLLFLFICSRFDDDKTHSTDTNDS